MRVKGIVLIASLGLLLDLATASPAVAIPLDLEVKAIVVSQFCVDEDTVQVDYSALVRTTSKPRFLWDFTNDGTWDTYGLPSPEVSHRYPEHTRVSAEVVVRNRDDNIEADEVDFGTLHC